MGKSPCILWGKQHETHIVRKGTLRLAGKILKFGVNQANIKQNRYLKTGKFSKRCMDFR